MKPHHSAQARTHSHAPSGLLANMIMQQPQEHFEGESIETRFGTIALQPQKPFLFKKGMLGMPDMTRFCLVDLPGANWKQFKLLQSLDDHSLSFIVLPVEIENPIIGQGDIEETAAELGIAHDQLALLLVVSIMRDGSKVAVSANARAPIFVNAGERSGEQYVLRNTRYMVRHLITARAD